jgi:paraquat-inducible protein B
MKKFIAVLSVFGIVACTNPSREEGLASLEAALAELEASMVGIDVDQMIADISSMQTQVETMQTDVDAYNEQAEGWLTQIDEILGDLAALQVIIDAAPTKDQVADILADLERTQEMIDTLVLLADYDYDGVINGLDQCPDTELGAEVDDNGCSAEQLED